jgi:hypothetical protein
VEVADPGLPEEDHARDGEGGGRADHHPPVPVVGEALVSPRGRPGDADVDADEHGDERAVERGGVPPPLVVGAQDEGGSHQEPEHPRRRGQDRHHHALQRAAPGADRRLVHGVLPGFAERAHTQEEDEQPTHDPHPAQCLVRELGEEERTQGHDRGLRHQGNHGDPEPRPEPVPERGHGDQRRERARHDPGEEAQEGAQDERSDHVRVGSTRTGGGPGLALQPGVGPRGAHDREGRKGVEPRSATPGGNRPPRPGRCVLVPTPYLQMATRPPSSPGTEPPRRGSGA